MSFLQATAIGNLGKAPRFNDVQDRRVCNFTMAVNRKVKGEKQTTWIEVVSWDDHKNKVIEEYLSAGTRVMVQGQLSVRTYTDNRSGNVVAQMVIDISFQGNLVLLGDKSGDDREERPATAKPKAESRSQLNSSFIDDDEIPF